MSHVICKNDKALIANFFYLIFNENDGEVIKLLRNAIKNKKDRGWNLSNGYDFKKKYFGLISSIFEDIYIENVDDSNIDRLMLRLNFGVNCNVYQDGKCNELYFKTQNVLKSIIDGLPGNKPVKDWDKWNRVGHTLWVYCNVIYK